MVKDKNVEPFVVVQLMKVTNAHGKHALKAFLAYFKLLLVNPKIETIKNYVFTVSGDNYFALQQMDDIINGKEIKVENPSLLQFQEEVKKLTDDKIKMFRKGKEYDWYLLGKFLEVFEGVSNFDEDEEKLKQSLPSTPNLVDKKGEII